MLGAGMKCTTFIFAKFAVVAGACASAGLLVANCSSPWDARAVSPSETPVPAALHMTLDELKEFRDFPVFWLGEEYQGLPVTGITHYRESGAPEIGIPPQEDVAVTYGTCTPPEPPLEGGCVPPITVFSERPCSMPPSLLVEEAKNGPERRMRGATVQVVVSGNVLVYFGQTMVNIASTRDVGLAAVGALRGANPAGLALVPDAASPLGPPVPEADCAFPPPTWLAAPLRTAIAKEAPQWIQDTFLGDQDETVEDATMTPTAATVEPGNGE